MAATGMGPSIANAPVACGHRVHTEVTVGDHGPFRLRVGPGLFLHRGDPAPVRPRRGPGPFPPQKDQDLYRDPGGLDPFRPQGGPDRSPARGDRGRYHGRDRRMGQGLTGAGHQGRAREDLIAHGVGAPTVLIPIEVGQEVGLGAGRAVGRGGAGQGLEAGQVAGRGEADQDPEVGPAADPGGAVRGPEAGRAAGLGEAGQGPGADLLAQDHSALVVL